ncbi:MAG: hypothetical protein IKI11_03410 [Neisseriaceae bacterium]|nr:hypothetical protein [Neisseriaceae bacterium]
MRCRYSNLRHPSTAVGWVSNPPLPHRGNERFNLHHFGKNVHIFYRVFNAYRRCGGQECPPYNLMVG